MSERLSTVPVFEDSAASKVVSSEWLREFGEWVILDEVVRAYPGTYTHDQVFKLTVHKVYKMIYFDRRSKAHSHQLQKINQELSKN